MSTNCANELSEGKIVECEKMNKKEKQITKKKEQIIVQCNYESDTFIANKYSNFERLEMDLSFISRFHTFKPIIQTKWRQKNKCWI